jgi:hypothetical protein
MLCVVVWLFPEAAAAAVVAEQKMLFRRNAAVEN